MWQARDVYKRQMVDYKSENFDEMKAKGLLTRVEKGVRIDNTYMGNTIQFDSTNPEAREYVWEKIKKNYYDKGVKIFWLDEAEPEYTVYDFENYRYHLGPNVQVGNVYPVMYAQAFFDGMKKEGQENIVNLLRCAWAGSQKDVYKRQILEKVNASYRPVLLMYFIVLLLILGLLFWACCHTLQPIHLIGESIAKVKNGGSREEDVYKRQEMLDICGVKEEMMAKIYESYEAVGTLLPEVAAELGVSTDVKVVAGAGDNAAAAVGTGTVGDGRCNISLGTSGTIFISSEKFGVDKFNALHAFAHADGQMCIRDSCNSDVSRNAVSAVLQYGGYGSGRKIPGSRTACRCGGDELPELYGHRILYRSLQWLCNSGGADVRCKAGQ